MRKVSWKFTDTPRTAWGAKFHRTFPSTPHCNPPLLLVTISSLGTIMCLRHCFDNYNVEELKEIIALVIDKLKALGKTAQLKAANMLKDDTEK